MVKVHTKQSMKILELVLIYLVPPLFFVYKPFSLPLIPFIFLYAMILLGILLKDKTFERKQLWNIKKLKGELKSIIMIFIPISIVLTLIVAFSFPEDFLAFPRRAGIFWIMVMILYPILSVYSQSIIYRAYFEHRFSALIPDKKKRLLVGAALFSFGHVLFLNWIALVFTFIGGVLFLYRYQKTKSLGTSAFEHALYGDMIFTIGLGSNFYSGAVGA